ncbi:unnamed protein product, partial [Musa acuminata var. zebrina]
SLLHRSTIASPTPLVTIATDLARLLYPTRLPHLFTSHLIILALVDGGLVIVREVYCLCVSMTASPLGLSSSIWTCSSSTIPL